MIFDDLAEIMNSDSALKISRQTGMSVNKIKRLAQGLPFVLDYNTIFALQRMGYDLIIISREQVKEIENKNKLGKEHIF